MSVMSWKENQIVYLATNTNGPWNKLSDHSRAPLDISVERIGTSGRMVDGTMRRQTIAKKRTFSLSWELLPSLTTSANPKAFVPVDGGWGGKDLENFFNTQNDVVYLRIKNGPDSATAITAITETYKVLIVDFNKSIVKRGPLGDMWNVSMSMEEV